MSAGFEQALALAELLRESRLADYQARHAKLMKRPRTMGGAAVDVVAGMIG